MWHHAPVHAEALEVNTPFRDDRARRVLDLPEADGERSVTVVLRRVERCHVLEVSEVRERDRGQLVRFEVKPDLRKVSLIFFGGEHEPLHSESGELESRRPRPRGPGRRESRAAVDYAQLGLGGLSQMHEL